MFERILIANRGEIAVRIIRACREMGIGTIAIYSDADREALHAQLADRAICIGPAAARDSYLNTYAILSAAHFTGAQAIHPGFGFLAENARFADLCQKSGLTFIGPDASCIDRLGNKLHARETMVAAGIPVIPGSDAALEDAAQAQSLAREIGFPVMLKASAGGGGRGIRRVESEGEVASAFASAQAEAQAAFGDGSLYLEKCISPARHIEVQILCDAHGNAVHLYERDCSVQRKNQKLLEEAPAANLPAAMREALGETAVRAAKAAGYVNAGTVEFLVDPDGAYYFMEMNTRIQVEHPVTEMVTGVDIVKEQIRIAAGLPLSFAQADVRLQGHSIECRINGEDPLSGFRPSCGRVEMLHIPGGPGIRFDSMLYPGYQVPPHYDSMLGKLIVHADTREAAIVRMRCALTELVVEGMPTTADYLLDVLRHPSFVRGGVYTSFLQEEM